MCISEIFIIFLNWGFFFFFYPGKNAKFTTSFSYGGVSFSFSAFYFEIILGLKKFLCIQKEKKYIY